MDFFILIPWVTGLKKIVDLFQRVATVVGGVFNCHVLVGMLVLLHRKTKAVGVAVMLVTAQLREQEINTSVDQAQVGDAAETLERGAISPKSQHSLMICNQADILGYAFGYVGIKIAPRGS